MLETIQYQCTQTSKNRVDYIRNLGCLDRLKIQVIYKYSDERFEIQEAVYEAQNRKLNKTIKNQSIYLWAFYFVPLVYIQMKFLVNSNKCQKSLPLSIQQYYNFLIIISFLELSIFSTCCGSLHIMK